MENTRVLRFQQEDDKYAFEVEPFTGEKAIELHQALSKRQEFKDVPNDFMYEIIRSLVVLTLCCVSITGPKGNIPVKEEYLLKIPDPVLRAAARGAMGPAAVFIAEPAQLPEGDEADKEPDPNGQKASTKGT
ncbi:MAG: hypothetical protein KGL39_27815 [Patescibacteria group bacterium]|nr:hypothetical protein [Patescibacteria group bacterium]